MYLRTASWAEDTLRSASAASSSSSPGSAPSPIVDFVLSLTNQRLYREVALALKQGLRDAKAEFSFMRVRGLRSLTKFLTSAVKSEKMVELFLESQGSRELQVVPVLFEQTFAPPEREESTSNPRVYSAPSKDEISLALRVLEACCLLDAGSRMLASRFAATKVLMNLLLNGEPPEQKVCLDVLLAVLLDSTSNQKEFDRLRGVQQIAELVKSKSVEDGVRLKCAEFLLLLIGRVLPASSRTANGLQHGEGRKGVLTVEGARQGIVEILGRKSGTILDAMPSSETGVVDFETEQSSLTRLAHKLISAS